jgi:hypothetical protein
VDDEDDDRAENLRGASKRTNKEQFLNREIFYTI